MNGPVVPLTDDDLARLMDAALAQIVDDALNHRLIGVDRDTGRWVAVCGCGRRFVGLRPYWDGARDLWLEHRTDELGGNS